MLKLPKLFFLAISFFLFLGFFRDEPKKEENQNSKKIIASVDKTELEAGEIFYYVITIEGNFSSPKIKEPSLEEFKIVSRQQSRSISHQRGKTRLKIELTYLLFSTQPGTFKIQPAKVVDGEKTYQSKPVEITITGKPLEEKKEPQPSFLGEGIEI